MISTDGSTKPTLEFYDLKKEKTVLTVENASRLLYVYPESQNPASSKGINSSKELILFDVYEGLDIIGFQVDLNSARSNENAP